mmetsp:Transcript_29198/g.34400  ORF Transcript_29198/g.34400 Transcript_29198/m.34400 type:complete len:110 (-) Transcript_29198:74-403(-)
MKDDEGTRTNSFKELSTNGRLSLSKKSKSKNNNSKTNLLSNEGEEEEEEGNDDLASVNTNATIGKPPTGYWDPSGGLNKTNRVYMSGIPLPPKSWTNMKSSKTKQQKSS